MSSAREARRAQRRAEIIEAASALFLEHGYGATSMDAVQRAVGGSKRTLYSHFSTKDDLLLAIVDRMAEQMLPIAEAELSTSASVDETLRRFGRLYTRRMTQPDLIQLFRLVIGEGLKNPELKALFIERGPQRGWRIMTAFFQRCVTEGSLAIEAPDEAAVTFLEMLRGPLFFRSYFFEEALTEAELDAHVDRVVALFLDGARAPRSGGLAEA